MSFKFKFKDLKISRAGSGWYPSNGVICFTDGKLGMRIMPDQVLELVKAAGLKGNIKTEKRGRFRYIKT